MQVLGRERRWFFLGLGLTFISLAVFAFIPRYLQPLLLGKLDVSTALHIHAITGAAWLGLFFWQSLLIHKKNFSQHRFLGGMSIFIAVAFLLFGGVVTLELFERGMAANTGGARPSLFINVSDLLLFAGLYAMGMMQRSNSAIHKRYMALSAIQIMNAGFFRVGAFLSGSGFAGVLIAPVLVAGFITLCAWRDKRQNGNIHLVFKTVGVGLCIFHFLRIPFAGSPIWASWAEGIADALNIPIG